MAISTTSIAPMVNTNANIQAWVAFFDTILTNAGWIQTSDTGQTASGSFIANTTPNTPVGYQIWRMNDSLQGTYPIFVKFEWGTASLSGYPSLWITIGTGSNGSGTITGVMVARIQQSNPGSSVTTFPCYASGTTSRFTIYSYYTAVTSATGMFLNIERTKDSTGADTNDGILWCFFCCGSGYAHGYSQYGNLGKITNAMPMVASYMSGSGSDGSATTMLMPIIEFATYGTVNTGIGVLAYATADLNTANQYTVNVSGTNHNYLAIAGYSQAAFVNWAATSLAMIYE